MRCLYSTVHISIRDREGTHVTSMVVLMSCFKQTRTRARMSSPTLLSTVNDLIFRFGFYFFQCRFPTHDGCSGSTCAGFGCGYSARGYEKEGVFLEGVDVVEKITESVYGVLLAGMFVESK